MPNFTFRLNADRFSGVSLLIPRAMEASAISITIQMTSRSVIVDFIICRWYKGIEYRSTCNSHNFCCESIEYITDIGIGLILFEFLNYCRFPAMHTDPYKNKH